MFGGGSVKLVDLAERTGFAGAKESFGDLVEALGGDVLGGGGIGSLGGVSSPLVVLESEMVVGGLVTTGEGSGKTFLRTGMGSGEESLLPNESLTPLPLLLDRELVRAESGDELPRVGAFCPGRVMGVRLGKVRGAVAGWESGRGCFRVGGSGEGSGEGVGTGDSTAIVGTSLRFPC